MEVLACPHCDRLFQLTQAVLGKKIRCRGCRGVFHVPRDTTSVPLGPLESSFVADASLPPLAQPCVIDGHDARSCPKCGRTFRMKESFAGKTIRCRGCKVTFRVKATAAAVAESPRAPVTPAQANGAAAPPVSNKPLRPPPAPAPAPPVSQPSPPPTIFEDIGDVLDDLVPGDKVPSVVRPRNVPQQVSTVESPWPMLIAVVLGGACAIPVTLGILRFIDKQKFEQLAAVLPDFLVGWLR